MRFYGFNTNSLPGEIPQNVKGQLKMPQSELVATAVSIEVPVDKHTLRLRFKKAGDLAQNETGFRSCAAASRQAKVGCNLNPHTIVYPRLNTTNA